jgi:hypothetical protein
VLALLTGGLFLYSSVLSSISYEVDIEPSKLYAGSAEVALLRIHGVNRLGGVVPFSHPRFRVQVEEGHALVSLRAVDDSTAYELRATGEAGEVTFHVITQEWPFPMFALLRIVSPTASVLKRTDRKKA